MYVLCKIYSDGDAVRVPNFLALRVGKDADRPTGGAWHGELIETRMAFQGLYIVISPAECGYVLALMDGKIQKSAAFA